jgi:hypothetical protein
MIAMLRMSLRRVPPEVWTVGAEVMVGSRGGKPSVVWGGGMREAIIRKARRTA